MNFAIMKPEGGSKIRKPLLLKVEWLSIIIIFILTRFIISGIAATVLLNSSPDPPVWIPDDHPSLQVFQQTASDPSLATRILLNGWYRWDTGYFVKIALAGYAPEDGSLSFMPLYPLLIRIFHLLTHANALLLSLIISNLLCFVGLILFYKVALIELGNPSKARDAFLFFITFPAAFFLFAGYSESLYLVLILSMWLLIRQGKFLWAAFAASLSILTRLQGIALILPLGWQVLVHLSQTSILGPIQEISAVLRFFTRPKKFIKYSPSKLVTLFGAVLLPPMTLLLYNFGLQQSGLSTVFGAYANRNSSLVMPWVGIAEFIKRINTIQFLPSDYVDLILLILFVSLTILGISKTRPAFTFYSLGVLGMIFSRSYTPNLLSGFMRFALTTFPIFLIMAGFNLRRLVKNLILLIFIMTQLFLVWLFINWIWVA